MKTAHLVAGLAYGDEGKGATVDYLVRKHQAGLVVRYNGGAQAAHNVITSDNKQHTFSQFGSGTFAGAKTHLSRFVIIEPISMMKEAEHLTELGCGNVWDKLTIEEEALVATPFQAAANRLIENFRNRNAHGSCGMGIGQTRGDHFKYGDKVLFAKDLKSDRLHKKLLFLREVALNTVYEATGVHLYASDGKDAQTLLDLNAVSWCMEQYEKWHGNVVNKNIANMFIAISTRDVVFEGAQGLLLDEKYGSAPHNTWTDITFNNAYELLADAGWNDDIKKIGVIRSYYTRHGAGPFPTEDETYNYPELHNSSTSFQGRFRQGALDFKQLRYACNLLGGIDTIALNHVDVFPEENRPEITQLVQIVTRANKAIISLGPTAEDRTEGTVSTINYKKGPYARVNIRSRTSCS